MNSPWMVSGGGGSHSIWIESALDKSKDFKICSSLRFDHRLKHHKGCLFQFNFLNYVLLILELDFLTDTEVTLKNCIGSESRTEKLILEKCGEKLY